ncbi:rod shape-determining protein [Verrucomicrobiota bacterium sgz303538]
MNTADEKPNKDATGNTMLLGFDWGTNTSCVQAINFGADGVHINEKAPTVVGYAKEGIVDNVLPNNAKILYGQDALKNRLHLHLVQPMRDGVIADLPSARDFAKHIRTILKASEDTEIRAVLGMPANADEQAKDDLRESVAGIFHKVIFIPEPFLAALGFRDESQLGTPSYYDPVNNSMFIDIGGGTTDVCLVQGYFPTAENQISFAFAGDEVDRLFAQGIARNYPDTALSTVKIRELKEKHSYVGNLESPIVVNVPVGGKMRKLDVGEQLGAATRELLTRVFDAVETLIARADSDSVTDLLQNIIITGGGSRIRNIATELQKMLTEAGYENPQVRVIGENYKDYVARGALKAARNAKERQWQQIIS